MSTSSAHRGTRRRLPHLVARVGRMRLSSAHRGTQSHQLPWTKSLRGGRVNRTPRLGLFSCFPAWAELEGARLGFLSPRLGISTCCPTWAELEGARLGQTH